MLGGLLHRARGQRTTILAFFVLGGILALPGSWTSRARLAARIPLPWRQPGEEVSQERERIRLLREETARLKDANNRLRAMLQEISAFQGVPGEIPEGRQLPATVILRGDSDGLRQGITIQAGWEDGVRVGDPVLHGRSLVGEVQEVGRRRSSVRLVTDSKSRFTAFGVGFQEEVVIEGRGEDRMGIRLISALVDPGKGEEILTAEEGKIPRGLVLGRIEREGREELAPLWRRRDLRVVRVIIEEGEAAR